MDKNEVALKIVLTLIEKGYFRAVGTDSNESVGKAVSELYNAVFKTIED